MRDRNAKTIALGILTGVSLLIGGAETARGTVLTETQTFNITDSTLVSDNHTQNLTFNQFDPSQGMLTSVEFVLTSNATSSVSIKETSNAAGPPPAIATGQNIAVFEEFFLGSPALVSLTTCDTDIAAGTICTASDTAGPTPFNFSQPIMGGLSAFEGTGTFMDTLTYGNQLSCKQDTGPGTCVFVSPTGLTWDGSFEVQFTFTPATSVPEPSSLALLGVALAGLPLLTTRRRIRASG